MRSKREKSDILNDIDPNILGSCLVVKIDKKGNIKKCNEPFTKIIGKQNEDVLNTPFSMFLSKKPHIINSWMDVLFKMNDNEHVLDLELPIQTGCGEDVVISWTNFPLEDVEKDKLSVLNLVGTPVTTASNKKNDENDNKHSKKNQGTKQKNQETGKKGLIEEEFEVITPKSKKHSIKIKIKKKTKKSSKKNDGSKKKKEKIIKKEKGKNPTEKPLIEFQEVDINSNQGSINLNQSQNKSIEDSTLINLKEQYPTYKNNNLLKKDDNEKLLINKIQGIISHKSFNTDEENRKKRGSKEKEMVKQSKIDKEHRSKRAISDRLLFDNNDDDKKLNFQVLNIKKQNKKLEQRNKKLEKKIKSLELKRNEIKAFLNPCLCFIRDCINVDKKRQEFSCMMDQMNQRKQKLERLETDMILEKKEFKKKIEEFFTWREKLEQLEQEIEKRRKYLAEHETFLNENFDKVLQHELNQPASYIGEVISELKNGAEDSPGIVEEDDLFESLTIEAVVLQRGRIKKVNSLFKKMIGFDAKDIIGKHLVDFVGPAGLAGVEQHYVNRLKGVDDLSYDTVFLAKNENEISVHVKVKAGEFQGQRAEIATFIENQ